MKIKLLVLSVFTMMLSTQLYSQDIITLRNGEEIKAKVKVIGDTEINYTKYSNIDGPQYTIAKEKVLFVRYENGEKEIFNIETQETSNDVLTYDVWGQRYLNGDVTSKAIFMNTLKTNDEAYARFKKGNTYMWTGVALTSISTGVFIFAMGENIMHDASATPMIISGVSLGLSIWVMYAGEKMMGDALDEFNEGNSVAINLYGNENGVGLALNF